MLEILHQDDHLVAIHKPAGLLVHRSMIDRHERRFAVQMLRDQLGRRVYPAHRLDKGTSGVLLFCLDQHAAAALGRAFDSGDVAKRYLAIVRGHPPEAGLIDHPLIRQVDAYAVDARIRTDRPPSSTPTAQTAQTRFKRLATVELLYAVDRYPSSRYALVALMPITGRQHQLRRHMKHLSHPIIGDATYGKGRHNRFFATHYGSQRMLLACVAMRFRHPVTNAPMEIIAPPSPDFAEVATALGWHDALQVGLYAATDS